MIGRRLITIEIGSRVAIPTRVTAPARASTCIIKFTVILIHRRPPPPTTTNHHNHRCHPRALFSLRAFRLAAIRTVVGGQFSISFHRRNRKNKRNFAGMGISWTNARSDPSYAYFSRIRHLESRSYVSMRLHRVKRSHCHFSRRNSRLGCLFDRAETRRRDDPRKAVVSCWVDVMNMPPTCDLDVKVEEPVAPEFAFLLLSTETNYRFAPPRPPPGPRYNYFLPTFRAETLRIFCRWNCALNGMRNERERKRRKERTMAKLGGLSPASGRLFPEIGGFDAKGKKEKKKNGRD